MASLFKRPATLTAFDHDDGFDDLYDAEDGLGQEVDVPPVQVVPGSLQDLLFSQLVDGLRASMRHTEPWMVRYLADQQDGVCAYCGLTLSVTGNRIDGAPRAMADLLVPLALGGSALEENRVLCCAECQNAKGGMDWLGFGRATAPAKLLARRREALLDAANHVLPLAVKGKVAAMDVLERRWAFPRFRVLAQVFGEVGYFGWDLRGLPNERSGEVRARLRFQFGGRDMSQGRFALYEVPLARWFEAAWSLVEENAVLVRPSMTDRERAAFPPFSPLHLDPDMRASLADDGWREHYERWHVLLTGDRWVQEARRVARWSVQAKPGQRVAQAKQRQVLREKPLADALARLAVNLDGLRTGKRAPASVPAERTGLAPGADLVGAGSSVPTGLPDGSTVLGPRPSNPARAQRHDRMVARHAAFREALRAGKPVPPREVEPVAPAEAEPTRAPLPRDVQDRLAVMRERLTARLSTTTPTTSTAATGRMGDARAGGAPWGAVGPGVRGEGVANHGGAA
ncbi:HNH endonuclease [Burkholderia vietnamiensis]|uniref:HNH endonuclease n=1 Tax=Burkholderia vietnamiensis TaxID=60552 RepID=UPI001CF44D90|nr:hypothetical protein [Burkholderia vietnamiensis]MCA8180706.1 hypothetical protein [Burkholderia vietnamiensis]